MSTITKVEHPEKFSFVVQSIVKQAASLSTCLRRRAGAAVFSIEGHLLATGHNRSENEALTCAGDCPRARLSYDAVPADSPYTGDTACIATHAEMVALDKAYGIPRDAWFSEPDIFLVSLYKPCHQCTEVIDRLSIATFYLEEL